MRGERIGSLIGAVGGLTFVLVNSAALPAAAAWALRVVGVLAFVAVLGLVVLRRRPGTESPPSRRQIRVYGTSVIAMAGGIVLGGRVLALLERTDLVVLWVVLAVGAHFVPFARAFGLPFFARLGWTLVGLAVLGGVVALLTSVVAVPPATAVLAGLVLLAAALRPAIVRHGPRA